MELTASRQIEKSSWFIRNKWLVLIGLIVVGSIIFAYATNKVVTTAVLASTLRQSTPLILGALCGLIGEHSGVINIGIEGQMLLAAFVAFLANVYLGNLVLAALLGALAGALMGAFLAFMAVTLKMDQIIGGTVLNILAVGLTGYFYVPGLTTQGKFLPIELGPLVKIPLIGPVLFNNPPMTYLAIILVFVLHYVLFYTRWGLRTRAVGEHPSAADTVVLPTPPLPVTKMSRRSSRSAGGAAMSISRRRTRCVARRRGCRARRRRSSRSAPPPAARGRR